jgi:hypothetical protein
MTGAGPSPSRTVPRITPPALRENDRLGEAGTVDLVGVATRTDDFGDAWPNCQSASSLIPMASPLILVPGGVVELYLHPSPPQAVQVHGANEHPAAIARSARPWCHCSVPAGIQRRKIRPVRPPSDRRAVPPGEPAIGTGGRVSRPGTHGLDEDGVMARYPIARRGRCRSRGGECRSRVSAREEIFSSIPVAVGCGTDPRPGPSTYPVSSPLMFWSFSSTERPVWCSRGMDLALRGAPQTLRLLKDAGVAVHIAQTSEAVDIYSRLAATETVGGLFHSTCSPSTVDSADVYSRYRGARAA